MHPSPYLSLSHTGGGGGDGVGGVSSASPFSPSSSSPSPLSVPATYAIAPELQPFFKSIFSRSQSLIGCELPGDFVSSSLSRVGTLSFTPSVIGGSSVGGGSTKEGGEKGEGGFAGKTEEGAAPGRYGSSSSTGNMQLGGTYEGEASACAAAGGRGGGGGFVSSYLAGVSVEEVLRLIEGARSTGDASLLKTKLSLVFSDVYRLNCSFVYPGKGCHPDFCGLDEVYEHLPEDAILPLGTSLLTCLSSSVKYVKYLKSGDALKFLLFALACFRLYGDGIEDMELDESDYTSKTANEAHEEEEERARAREEERREREERERRSSGTRDAHARERENEERAEKSREDAESLANSRSSHERVREGMGRGGEEEEEKDRQQPGGGGEDLGSSRNHSNVDNHERPSSSPTAPPPPSGTSSSSATGASSGGNESGTSSGFPGVATAAHQKPLGGVSKGESVFTALVHLLFNLPPEGKLEFLRLAAEFPDDLFEYVQHRSPPPPRSSLSLFSLFALPLWLRPWIVSSLVLSASGYRKCF